MNKFHKCIISWTFKIKPIVSTTPRVEKLRLIKWHWEKIIYYKFITQILSLKKQT